MAVARCPAVSGLQRENYLNPRHGGSFQVQVQLLETIGVGQGSEDVILWKGIEWYGQVGHGAGEKRVQ